VELLFVLVIAACVGGLVRYVLPGRHSYGLLLLPAVGVVATAILWVALTWVGWKFDGGWIWVVALVGGGVVTVAVELLVWRGRERSDQHLLHELSGGRA
jgi:O-antigen/teichoic acid export membrane protein